MKNGYFIGNIPYFQTNPDATLYWSTLKYCTLSHHVAFLARKRTAASELFPGSGSEQTSKHIRDEIRIIDMYVYIYIYMIWLIFTESTFLLEVRCLGWEIPQNQSVRQHGGGGSLKFYAVAMAKSWCIYPYWVMVINRWRLTLYVLPLFCLFSGHFRVFRLPLRGIYPSTHWCRIFSHQFGANWCKV